MAKKGKGKMQVLQSTEIADYDDPRWSLLSERAESETGKPLIARGSKHHTAQGALVPSDWLVPH